MKASPRLPGGQNRGRTYVAAAVIDLLGSLDLSYPKVGKEKLKELAAAKEALSKYYSVKLASGWLCAPAEDRRA